MKFEFGAIGQLRSCFGEKFGVPRQSMMVKSAAGVIKLNREVDAATVQQLETFSHIWIVFVFHKTQPRAWRSLIETPRIESGKVGVFASRAPYRPNPIGMSVVRLERVDTSPVDGIEIHVSGIDLLDGTPVLDIKPYLPYADAFTDANAGWASDEIRRYSVQFSPDSLLQLTNIKGHAACELQRLIEEVMEWDPRPTSQRKAVPIQSDMSEGREFAFRIQDVDVHWQISRGTLLVKAIRDLNSSEA